jgi:hypothetical protein
VHLPGRPTLQAAMPALAPRLRTCFPPLPLPAISWAKGDNSVGFKCVQGVLQGGGYPVFANENDPLRKALKRQ